MFSANKLRSFEPFEFGCRFLLGRCCWGVSKDAVVGGTVRFSCGDPSCALDRTLIIIIITYIYHALMNALSSHIINIRLNLILYTHLDHSPIKNNLRKVLY